MAEKVSNNGQTTLNGAINNSVTSLTLTSASTFPTSGKFRIRIDDEIMLVSSIAGAVCTVARGQEGTTAASHADLATVRQVLTAAGLSQLASDAAGLAWTAIQKQADDVYTSNAALTADSEMTLAVAAGEAYEIEFTVFCTGNAVNYQCQIALPTSCEGVGVWEYINTGGNVTHSPVRASSNVFATQTVICIGTTQMEMVTFRGVICVQANAGTVVWKAAQSSSNATPNRTKAGSVFRYRKLV